MTQRVLIVDDEELVRCLVRDTLKLVGYETALAANGVQALEMLEAEEYDLVITDVVMPEMAGFELLKRIKKMGAGVKVIILTGFSRDHEISDFLLHGADEYLAKPFQVDELLRTVRKLLG
jgi:CheY-like chemotaxis protein